MPEARAQRRSPLDHRPPVSGEEGALRLAEMPFVGKFILRCAPALAGAPMLEGFALQLPGPLASAAAGRLSALWLGPDEWMLVAPPEEADALAGKAAAALAGVRHQLVDVGDYYTVIEIGGAKAREALMKLTTLDLHARAFTVGRVAGSVFGRANATLWLRAEENANPLFWLFVRWSMADYLWCLVADAGREWGVPAQMPLGGERLTID
jgi:sarcosine oxidase subunit gamma